uniref:cardiolipin synthase (CMP-forming) n=1 Tax=Meloidogyne incognita TaxID=6306 RepID=A0A914LJ25_MELIC
MLSVFRNIPLEAKQISSIFTKTWRRFSLSSLSNNQKNGKEENKKENQKKFEFVLANERLNTIPNLLSAGRIVATPIIGWLVVNELYSPACVLFVIAGVSDLVDGFIARRFPSQKSLFGSIIDPVADKFLISTLFITLTYMHLIPVYLTVIALVRDGMLVTGGLILRYKMLDPPITFSRFFNPTISSIQIKPSKISKFNTGLQLLLLSLSLASPIFHFVDHPALEILSILTACTTVYSGLQYAFYSGILRVKLIKPKIK